MNFTSSPFERMMKENPVPRLPLRTGRQGLPSVMAAVTGGGSPVCSATGSFSKRRSYGR